MKLRRRCWFVLIPMMIAACAARSAGPPAAPKPSPAALAAKPVPWSKRDPAAPLWPAQVRRVQVIITNAWAKDERFVWLIANGTDVVAVYRTTGEEVGDVVDSATHAYRAVYSNPKLDVSAGVFGSTYAPPPPPPPLDGLPLTYVEHVLLMAWRFNLAAERAEADARE